MSKGAESNPVWPASLAGPRYSETREYSHEDLVSRARAGEVGAFAVLYRLHSNVVLDAMQLQVSPDEAEPFFAELSVRAFEAMHDVKDRYDLESVLGFRSWLSAIATAEVRHLRSRRAYASSLAASVDPLAVRESPVESYGHEAIAEYVEQGASRQGAEYDELLMAHTAAMWRLVADHAATASGAADRLLRALG